MTSPTLRPCSRGSSRVRFSSPIKPTTRTESAPKSELRVPFPTSPAAPTAGESPGGQRLSIASATISNAFSTSSSRTVGSPPDTISLAPRSSPSSNSQPCEFGFDQLSPRPSALRFSKFVPECAALYHELRKPGTSLRCVRAFAPPLKRQGGSRTTRKSRSPAVAARHPAPARSRPRAASRWPRTSRPPCA